MALRRGLQPAAQPSPLLRRDRQLVAHLPIVETVLPPSEPSTITTEAIRWALDALSPDDREMILLVAVDELSAAQLGVVFDCSAIVALTC